jgi:1-hydroxycarotenoid 3,4-desaturase
MLIAAVEQDGVWTIGGGMQRLADAMYQLARSLGVVFHFGKEAKEILLRRGKAVGVDLKSGERIDAQAVVVNADQAAVAVGLLGAAVAPSTNFVRPKERSLSAVTWALLAEAKGFPLLRHNVFFSNDYQSEFDDVFQRGQLPRSPTVYICAQDRFSRDIAASPARDRLLLLVNAPANGDTAGVTSEEITACESRIFHLLETCGLTLIRTQDPATITAPQDFNKLFPATGGALYGRASHGWLASFQRPGSKTSIPGLYLAGGSTHPGAGVPMAALSGRLAAQALITDLTSTRRYHKVVISGGTSTPSATTDDRRSR